MDPRMLDHIDKARRKGLSYDEVHEHLRQAGVPDPKRLLDVYAEEALPDGRKRGAVNLGDPDEHDSKGTDDRT